MWSFARLHISQIWQAFHGVDAFLLNACCIMSLFTTISGLPHSLYMLCLKCILYCCYITCMSVWHLVLDHYLRTLPPVAADYNDYSTTYLMLWIQKKTILSFICNPYMAQIGLFVLFVIVLNNVEQLLCWVLESGVRWLCRYLWNTIDLCCDTALFGFLNPLVIMRHGFTE